MTNKTRTIVIPKGYKLVKETVSHVEDGLKWWTKRGFKINKTGLSYQAKSGKNYPMVEGVTKEGKTLQLKAVRGGSVYTPANF